MARTKTTSGPPSWARERPAEDVDDWEDSSDSTEQADRVIALEPAARKRRVIQPGNGHGKERIIILPPSVTPACERGVLPPPQSTCSTPAPTAAGAADSTASEATTKRKDYLHWDEYFMAVAFLSAQRSKDPSTQVGACIVNSDNKIVGIGYNGFPNGCSDDELPWARSAPNQLDTKYPYVCHAEMNAILNKNCETLKSARIYVALFPCNECAKLIIQSGIREVIYVSDKYHDSDMMTASRRLLEMAGVHYRHFKPKSSITLDFDK